MIENENKIKNIIGHIPEISKKIAEKGFARYTISSIRRSFFSEDASDDTIEKQINDILNDKGIKVIIDKEKQAISFRPIEGLFKFIPGNIKPPIPTKPPVTARPPTTKNGSIDSMWEKSYKTLPQIEGEIKVSNYETVFQNELSSQKVKLKEFISSINSPEKIYELFRKLNYPKDKILDISLRNMDDFEFAKEEKEKVKNIYTIFSYEKDLNIFLIETKSVANQFIRYISNVFDRRYNRFMLIFTIDYNDIIFVFPDRKIFEEGKHKLKITKLILKPGELHNYTDIETISNIILSGNEKTYRDIFIKWRQAFNVEKITDHFFNDYKEIFLTIRRRLSTQKIEVKKAHEYTLQFLNRIMFVHFISKKRWLGNNIKFMKWYWDRYRQEKTKGNTNDNTFYQNWLRALFFEAFNTNQFKDKKELPEDVNKVLSDAPYLNGGLFKKNQLDELPIDIDDNLFQNVFNFLERYNFTIKEDMPLDAEVAVDPQMIGYIYESLANVAESVYQSENDMRNAWGIFYTPRIEVDFMVRRSLVEYIAKNLPNISKEKIYQLLFDDKGTDEFTKVAEYFEKENLWSDLERILDNLLVIDPACGVRIRCIFGRYVECTY